MSRSEFVRQFLLDREQVSAALRRRRRGVRMRLARGLQPGVDAGIDRDLRDVAVLAEMARGLRALLAEAGWRPPAGAIHLDLPAWLEARLPSDACRAVVALRRAGLSWREIERRTGVRAGNAVAMAADVARVARAWPLALHGRRAGLGRREIARRFGLPRWGVRAILEHAPPDGEGGGPPLPAVGDAPARPDRWAASDENGRTPAGGRSHAPLRPPADVRWRVLRTEAGCALRVKAEIERRCAARLGRPWRREVRCVAAVAAGVRPGGRGPRAAARPACEGFLAIQATAALDLDELLRDLPHARGWIGRSASDAGDGGRRARRLPSSVSTDELAAWFRRMGWEGVPEARP